MLFASHEEELFIYCLHTKEWIAEVIKGGLRQAEILNWGMEMDWFCHSFRWHFALSRSTGHRKKPAEQTRRLLPI